MRKIILAFLGFALFGAAHSAHAECIVADPSPTPLNVRTAPYGRIVGALDNGQVVSDLDSSIDNQGRPWVYVADDTKNPLGRVYREWPWALWAYCRVLRWSNSWRRLGKR
jgi:hypothetical protein